MSLADFTDHEIDPSEIDPAWGGAGWGEAWHPDNVDVWDFIGEVLNDALDYLDDGGYLG